MSKILSEINRVREIMGFINEAPTGTTKSNTSSVHSSDLGPKAEKIKPTKKEKQPTARQMARELKDKWKIEVFSILDSISEGDVFGFQDVYRLQKQDKLRAVLNMLQNLMCVNAKIARTVILAEDNAYDGSKLMSTAQFPKGGGHEGLISTIENNIERLDKKFKLGRGGMKVDKKLRPIKRQLKQARAFITELIPYLNWSDATESLGFEANSTEEILLNSKNLNKLHIDCANELNTTDNNLDVNYVVTDPTD
tara:strand:+ start:312 stop:1067 length:756 start_codon:yes stop_codon:yes gene_type:complete